jgi:uncharacterized protein (DUF58 family)
MNARVTHGLLALIAGLLAANLLAGEPMTLNSQAQAAAPIHDVLRARQVDLVAANGSVVAQLYAGEDGAGNIRLRSGNGEVRVKLGASADGAGLILMNQNTEPAASLSVAPAQVALRLTQADKGTRVVAP